MATLFTESFTGTDGASWSTSWVPGSTQGTATIDSNRGYLNASGTGYKTVQRFLNTTAVGSCELYVEFTLQAPGECYIYMFVRADSSQTAQYYPTGYGVVVNPSGTSYTLEGAYGTGEYLQQTYPMTWSAGSIYKARVRVVGNVLQSKVWPYSNTEPTDWQLTATDTDNGFPTGRVELAYTSGSTSNSGVKFDNLTLSDAAQGYTGSAARTGSGTASATGRPTPRFTGARTGSGSVTQAATPKLQAGASQTGSGSVIGTGTAAQKAAGTGATTGSGSLTGAGALAVGGGAALSGLGTAMAVGRLLAANSAALTGTGALSAISSLLAADSSVLTGTGVTAAVGSPAVSVEVFGTGTGTTAAVGSAALTAAYSSTGSGVLDATVLPALAVISALTGTGQLVGFGKADVPIRPRLMTVGAPGTNTTLSTPNSRTEVAR